MVAGISIRERILQVQSQFIPHELGSEVAGVSIRERILQVAPTPNAGHCFVVAGVSIRERILQEMVDIGLLKVGPRRRHIDPAQDTASIFLMTRTGWNCVSQGYRSGRGYCKADHIDVCSGNNASQGYRSARGYCKFEVIPSHWNGDDVVGISIRKRILQVKKLAENLLLGSIFRTINKFPVNVSVRSQFQSLIGLVGFED